jgi:hypothetical protein
MMGVGLPSRYALWQMTRLWVTVLMDVAAARDDVTGLEFVLSNDGSDAAVTALEEKTQVGAGEHAALRIGIEGRSHDGLLEQLMPLGVVTQIVDVILIDDGDDDGHLAGAPYLLAIDGPLVDGDGKPDSVDPKLARNLPPDV